MSLFAGTKLGSHEVVAPLGAGGMGEVYRARDTKLGREVALKVLPEAVARDPERLTRLRREAQVLASLNHPNIGAIYGFEDSGSTHALVMELVEGLTLAQRLQSGAMAADEALPIARQICEAVEYAHERGIIHRDLKPANVKITAAGLAKVLDFGLAKALEDNPATADISNSPTLSRMATQAGVILGTAAYMSPEQAKGKPVDRRTDIWAFGCVLFEMLSGTTAFGGETATEVLAAVIKSEPDWNALPATTPVTMRDLVQRCLRKNPRQRLQSIGDARIALEEFIAHPHPSASQEAKPPQPPAWRRALPWAVAALLALVAGLFAAGYYLRSPAPLSLQAYILPPSQTSFTLGSDDAAGPLVVSPDGKQIAFVAADAAGKTNIFVRALDDRTARMIAGTEAAVYPFWSPDGESLGFFSNGKLRRVSTHGGPVLDICDVIRPRGGNWGANDTILFAPDITAGIFRVHASPGSIPVQVTTVSSQQTTNRWPVLLPDGKHFIYLASNHADPFGNARNGIYFASLDGKENRFLVAAQSNAVFAHGQLLRAQDGSLLATAFDPDTGRMSGDTAALAADIGFNISTWRAAFDASDNGVLVYQPALGAGNSQLLLFDRGGKQEQSIDDVGHAMLDVRLSPDGHRAAVYEAGGAQGFSTWIQDLDNNTRMRLTFGLTTEGMAWSPDGRALYYAAFAPHPASNTKGTYRIVRKAADGTGQEQAVLESPDRMNMSDVSPDGRTLLFEKAYKSLGATTWVAPLAPGAQPRPLLEEPIGTYSAGFSPDGKWVLFVSAESGRYELYSLSLNQGGRQQLTSTGALFWRWRADGQTIDYATGDGSVYELPVHETAGQLASGIPRLLFKMGALVTSSFFGRAWDATRDRQRFILATSGGQTNNSTALLITHWPSLLKKQ